MKWIVCQLGARMHFAVPRILEARGALAHLFTDLYAPGWLRAVAGICPPLLLPSFVRQVAGRYAPGIPRSKITDFPALGIGYAWRRRHGGDLTQLFLETNRRFGEMVCARQWEAGAGVYVFNAAGLEILRRARSEGRRTVLEQTIAPNRVERRLMAEEQASFPEWEEEGRVDGGDYIAREEEEWELAEKILCGSQFVVDGIRECGGPVEKCVVVPYGVERAGGRSDERRVKSAELGVASDEWRDQRSEGGGRKTGGSVVREAGGSVGREEEEVKGEELRVESGKVGAEGGNVQREYPEEFTRERRLRVLTVGTVGLRKGVPYVSEAAKRLRGRAEFRVIGSLKVRDAIKGELAACLDLRDRVPRSEMAGHFAWADVFLLPSLCEGSATVTYEAMAAGLPVVCTANTGSMVRDGVDGFLVPVRDAGAIVAALENLRAPERRLQMSQAARERSHGGTLTAYGERLVRALGPATGGDCRKAGEIPDRNTEKKSVQ